MEPVQPKSIAMPIILSVLISAIVFGGVGYYIGQSMGSNNIATQTTTYTTPTATATATTLATATTSATSSADWKTYENTRIGYSLQYNENDPKIDVDEIIKYDASKTYLYSDQVDMVAFVYNNNTYRIEAYFTDIKTLESWMDYASKNLGIGSANLSDYTKTTIGGNTAYSKNSELVSYVMKNNKVISIAVSKPTGGTAVLSTDKNDSVYKQILSTFKFTK